MNDLEREVREVLEQDALDAPVILQAPGDVTRRVRRHQVVMVALGSFVAIGLVLGTIGALRGLTPGTRTVPGGETRDCSAIDGGPIGAGPVVPIASGVDPVGGQWRLRAQAVCGNPDGVLISSGGDGGHFGPLGDRDISRTLYFTGPSDANLPLSVLGLVSERTDRVELQLRDGRSVVAEVHSIPARFVGPAQVFQVLVQSAVELDGYVVAFDASGTILQRQPIGLSRESPGPTQEIDDLWAALRRSRDAVEMFYFEPLSFVGIEDALTVPGVTFNTAERAVPGEISIRHVSERELVLVGTTTSGQVYCLGVSHGPTNHSGFSYGLGRTDAQTYDECSGGWD
jgi:hypothetical protein